MPEHDTRWRPTTAQQADPQAPSRLVLVKQRRALIGTTSLLVLMALVVSAALVAFIFSADQRAWSDESRVAKVDGEVVEVVGSDTGSCKGADFDSRIDWTQDGEQRSAWTDTCRADPGVGEPVTLWVRDDGQITLTEPSTTIVMVVVGAVFILALAVGSLVALRVNLRNVGRKLAALGDSAG